MYVGYMGWKIFHEVHQARSVFNKSLRVLEKLVSTVLGGFSPSHGVYLYYY